MSLGLEVVDCNDRNNFKRFTLGPVNAEKGVELNKGTFVVSASRRPKRFGGSLRY